MADKYNIKYLKKQPSIVNLSKVHNFLYKFKQCVINTMISSCYFSILSTFEVQTQSSN